MKSFLKVLIFSIILTVGASALAQSHTPENVNKTLSPMLKNVIPAVVNIKSEGKLPPTVYIKENGQPDPQAKGHTNEPEPISKPFTSLGSGVIVDAKEGYIVTNSHVIKDADRITVTLNDGRTFPAKLIGADEPSDIAVIQVKPNHNKLTALPLGNSNDVNVGDYVVAIGNPFGLGQSVTSGIVSALQRTNLRIEGYENFIQVDAPINFGNSGGALVNTDGFLMGINTAMLSPVGGNVGIGFAIPSNMVNNVYQQLVKYGKVERGIVGVMVQTLSPDLAEALNLSNKTGAIVTQVIPNTPAAKAGFKVGDLITDINGSSISTSAQVVNTVGFLRQGTTVKFDVLRNGKTISLRSDIIGLKDQKKENQDENPYFYGVGFQNFDQYNPIHGNVKGVITVGVIRESNAWTAGLRPGDIIVEANHKAIKNLDDLEDVSKHMDGKSSLVLNVLREEGALFVAITPA